jgi:hypothetical protein
MKINFKKVLPAEISSYGGYRAVRIATAFYLMVMIARSLIHLSSMGRYTTHLGTISISIIYSLSRNDTGSPNHSRGRTRHAPDRRTDEICDGRWPSTRGKSQWSGFYNSYCAIYCIGF